MQRDKSWNPEFRQVAQPHPDVVLLAPVLAKMTQRVVEEGIIMGKPACDCFHDALEDMLQTFTAQVDQLRRLHDCSVQPFCGAGETAAPEASSEPRLQATETLATETWTALPSSGSTPRLVKQRISGTVESELHEVVNLRTDSHNVNNASLSGDQSLLEHCWSKASPSHPDRSQRISWTSSQNSNTSRNGRKTRQSLVYTAPFEAVPEVSRFKSSSTHSLGANVDGVKVDRDQRTGLFTFVTSVHFETFFAFIILLNLLIMALECQYEGVELGYEVAYPGYDTTAVEYLPFANMAFQILEYLIGAAFTFEVVVKMIALKCKFFRTAWNLFDAFIIGFWLVSLLETVVVLNPMLLRLVRLARLLRLLRLVRTFQIFDVLRLLIGSLRASGLVLLWTFLLLALIMAMSALTLNMLITNTIILNELAPQEQRTTGFIYFGSFIRAFITMFELTLGNWVPVTRMIYEINEWYGIPLIMYQAVVTFAVLNVIRAIFIHETMKVAGDDEDLMVMERERQMRRHSQLMKQLFKSKSTYKSGKSDEDGEDVADIDFEEFETIVNDVSVRTWLAAMQLDVRDPAAMFNIMDMDGDGWLSANQLSTGFARLKGTARSMDVVAIMHEQRTIASALEALRELIFEDQVSRQEADENSQRCIDQRLSRLERMVQDGHEEISI